MLTGGNVALVQHGGSIPSEHFFDTRRVDVKEVCREAMIVGEEGFPNWMMFGDVSHHEAARRMANWFFMFRKVKELPKDLSIKTRDVGSSTQFTHFVEMTLQIRVIPTITISDDQHYALTCFICKDAMPLDWDYAACEKCGKELAYDFVADDLNFDAANGR